ncbi:MAG: nitroreductase family deazaflavin-dependent oxidoreductase [Chloroflexi bacterium]|nr:nitroreductase family deazaflavin-dependent oxidoreductase [Chloroflexota bacterium]
MTTLETPLEPTPSVAPTLSAVPRSTAGRGLPDVPAATEDAVSGSAALPYGPTMARLLRPLQRGFLVLNRSFMAPLIRHGFGWLVGNPLTGHLMLLRTRGRRSGLLREAPLGYVIRDGAVYCVAGYGRPTPWFQNLLADPDVEVILPIRRFRGQAVPVTDPIEWLGAYRALIRSFGIVGRAVVGDVRRVDDATLLERHRSLPLIRITPQHGNSPLVAGTFDPGGRGWIVSYGATLALGLLLVRRAGVRRGR